MSGQAFDKYEQLHPLLAVDSAKPGFKFDQIRQAHNIVDLVRDERSATQSAQQPLLCCAVLSRRLVWSVSPRI